MENLGSEIGQKMRHAVKAKLLELGTGTSSGYVDDELPDYVMIMVANKRSKQQMIEDLTLFLGSNTGEFVNWLHQVLQKLQEVSLPAPVTPKGAKRKSSESSEPTHKKEKRKEKKSKKPVKSQSSNNSSKATTDKSVAAPSITDVFANQLIQKAKKNLQSEAAVNVKKRERTPEVDRSDTRTPENDFDIPTITEIAENSVEQTRRKELLELEEIQKKIYQAKRQLRNLTSDESEDEDFINLKADGEEFDEPDVRHTESVVDSTRNQAYRNPSPIVFDLPARRVSTSEESEKERTPKKSSVKERLGSKPTENTGKNVISLSANRRSEKEIYIPVFRRREMDKPKEAPEPKIRRTRETSVEKKREKREKESKPKEVKPSVRQRIGSRVIVAPPKPEFDEEAVEVAVSSVVKIKPRPVVPKGKQANKNLLLRAMAEAQKSTASVMRRSVERERVPKGKVTASKTNILIEVPRGNSEASREDEYVPTPVNQREQDADVVYIPQVSCEEIEDSDDAQDSDADDPKRPQFVVTLDGIFKGINADLKKKSLSKSAKERVGEKKVVSVEPRSRDTKRSSPEKKEEPPKRSPEEEEPSRKRRIRCSPIRFDLDEKKKSMSPGTPKKVRKETPEKEVVDKNSKSDDGHTVTIRRIETKKYENLPSLLSSVTVVQPAAKPKDRCKYFPNCTKGDTCEFIHPSTPCKSFPNCKFGDLCLYLHPKCKFDLTCSRHNCNFSHTPVISAAPPLASHVVPVHNYKMISTQNLLPPICKFYPKCNNTLCNFYHPKLCRFGKACMNKVECNFYHHDIPAVDKFKWVSTASGTAGLSEKFSVREKSSKSSKMVMQGMSFATLKKHPALIPLYACTALGMCGALYYTIRLATRNPDVTWNRSGNPEPWQEYRNKQYKFYSPIRDYSKTESQAPKYEE